MLQTPAGLEKKGHCPAGKRTLTFRSSNLQFPNFIWVGRRGRGRKRMREEEGMERRKEEEEDHIGYPLPLAFFLFDTVHTAVYCEADGTPFNV
jgi:hypothetical protein